MLPASCISQCATVVILSASSRCGAGEEILVQLRRPVERGLEYLAGTQNEQGAWAQGQGSAPGVVGLAALAFMAHGEVPGEGRYGKALDRCLGYILSQAREDGLLSGSSGSTMYNHGFATLALAEAYGMSGREDLYRKLEKAVQLIIKSQSKQLGGWRYNPTSQDSDITVTGCQMMALRAAKNAGLDVPEEIIKRGAAYIKKCSVSGGGFGYQPSSGAGVARSGIGVLVLSLCGEHDSPEVASGVTFLRTRPHENSSYYYYGLYYCSQAMFQAGGKDWENWNAATIQRLISTQGPDGAWQGGAHGPAYSTAMALLALEVNWQLLPIYLR